MKKSRDHEPMRCAIYTRKSTDEGLDLVFNSLDAQRDSAEAYIKSQKHEGWVALADRYDDGGFTGGNMDRPALRRLLADIKADKIDCVVVYKVDRLSRSLLDFARMMEAFDEHHVSFVSVTQQFNTTHSMGRLTLNILLSFAQFEREVIAERTRDKIAATRRKGQWCGGPLILGYDVELDARGPRLVVNPAEAEQVREIFALYIRLGSLLDVVKALERRGWRTKRWTTRKGHERGGQPFNKNRLHALLTNVTYSGRLTYKKEIHPGVHEAIVDKAIFNEVQERLAGNYCGGPPGANGRSTELLRGLLHCGPCNSVMIPTYTQRGQKRYRYYVCQSAQKRGRGTCPTKAVPAGEMDTFVVEQIRAVGQNPGIVAETIGQVRRQLDAEIAELEAEEKRLKRQITDEEQQSARLAADADSKTGICRRPERLAENQERLRVDQQRLTEVREDILERKGQVLDEAELKAGITAFEPVWESLTSAERAKLLGLLIEKIVYDGRDGSVEFTFRPTGIKELARGNKEQRP